jgi:hypothetical protein
MQNFKLHDYLAFFCFVSSENSGVQCTDRISNLSQASQIGHFVDVSIGG